MIGLTLRYKWITWAVFRFPVWSPSSHQGGYLKKCIYITWIGLPGWYKNTQSVVCYFKKNTINTIYNQCAFYTDDPTGSEMN
jgi:hypothetical protein